MFISVLELEREPLEFSLEIESGSIAFGQSIVQIGTMKAQGRADLIEERRGPREIVQDIRLRADFSGRFRLACARCLEPVECKVGDKVDLIFRPLEVDARPAERAISTSETEIGYYRDGGLALEDVLREQVLLSLPARALCREDCAGLCPGCGCNLNSEGCSCGDVPADARWTALSDLRGRMKIRLK